MHRGSPPAADVEQCHARLEVQLVEVQIDLGDLCFLQRLVVTREVGAAVGPRRVLEQSEEVIGQVVVRLDVFRTRPCLRYTLVLGHQRVLTLPTARGVTPPTVRKHHTRVYLTPE